MTPLTKAARVALLTTLAACDSGAAAPPAQPPPPPAVGVAAVETQALEPFDELSGRVEAIHRVDIRPRVSGYVTAVHYKEGTEVAAGTVLFTVDTRPYEAAYARARAELARANARVELAHLEGARTDKLVASNAVPKAELDVQRSTSAQAEADVQAARAALALAQLDLEFTQVRAPISGRTGRAQVNVGDYVAAGPAPTSLTSVATTDPVYVYFTGDERTFLRFASHAEKAGISVGLADETGYPHTGTVDFVDNRLDPSTGTILVRAVVPNPDKRLAPGLFARVKLTEGAAAQVAVVADKAILTDQDRKYVYVLEGDTVARKDVELGRALDGKRVITKGVKVGDNVIVDGTQKVFPGGKATIAPPPAVKAASLP